MPLFVYECKDHGKFELLKTKARMDQVLDIPETQTCPECGQDCLKLVTAHARTPNKWKV